MADTLINGNGADTLTTAVAADCHTCCPRYDCVDSECVRNDATGFYGSLEACEAACAGDPVQTCVCVEEFPPRLYGKYQNLPSAAFGNPSYDYTPLNDVVLTYDLTYLDVGAGLARYEWDKVFPGHTGPCPGVPIDAADCTAADVAITQSIIDIGPGDYPCTARISDLTRIKIGGSFTNDGINNIKAIMFNSGGPTQYLTVDSCAPFIAHCSTDPIYSGGMTGDFFIAADADDLP